MKRFLKYIAIFILPILFIGISMEMLLRRIPNDYSYKKNYLEKHSKNVRILILGNSHAFFGIDPKYFSTSGFNAAQVSQSMNYDMEILKKYDHKWDSLKCIVLPVDYFSLYSSLENSVEAWRSKNYVIYYGIRTNYSLTDNAEILSNNFRWNITMLYNFYRKHISNLSCSDLGWGTTYKSTIQLDLVATGKIAAERHRFVDDKYFNSNLALLRSIIEFAKHKNVKILLFTSPAYRSYVQNLDSAQLLRTINTATAFTDEYKDVSYFNLLRDDSFTESDFYDADHLNEIGAKKLSIKIDSMVMKLDKK